MDRRILIGKVDNTAHDRCFHRTLVNSKGDRNKEMAPHTVSPQERLSSLPENATEHVVGVALLLGMNLNQRTAYSVRAYSLTWYLKNNLEEKERNENRLAAFVWTSFAYRCCFHLFVNSAWSLLRNRAGGGSCACAPASSPLCLLWESLPFSLIFIPSTINCFARWSFWQTTTINNRTWGCQN